MLKTGKYGFLLGALETFPRRDHIRRHNPSLVHTIRTIEMTPSIFSDNTDRRIEVTSRRKNAHTEITGG